MTRRSSLLLAFAILLAGTIGITLAVTAERPQQIIRTALKNFKSAGSFRATAAMDTIFRATLPNQDPAVAAVETALPLHVVGSGGVNIGNNRTTGSLHFTVADEQTGASIFGAELIAAETGTTYIKFDATASAAASGPDLSALSGRWFFVDKDAAAIFQQPDTGSKTTSSGQWASLWSEITEGNAFVYREQTASEVIGGASSWHFILGTRPGAFDQVLVDLYSVLRIGAAKPESEVRVRQAIAKHQVGGEIWIDKKSKQILRFGLAVVPPPSETIALPVTVVLDLTDLGEPVQTAAPADAEPLSSALTKLFVPAAPAPVK